MSDGQVAEARSMYTTGQWTRAALAERYGVSSGTMDAVLGRGLKPRKGPATCTRCSVDAEPGRRRCARHLADGREASKAHYDDKVKFWPSDMPQDVRDAWL